MRRGVRAEIVTCLLTCAVLLQPRVLAKEHAPEVRCWDAEDAHHPPSFVDYFPDNAPGAEALSHWWSGSDREDRPPDAVLTLLRQGLRRYEGDHAALLRWTGRRFIGSQGVQDPAAIEIMYHASDSQAPAHVRGSAVRFGLLAVRPMSPNILKALAALSMASENPDELGRIAVGIDGQRGEALNTLAVYLEEDDPAIQEKAAVVRRLWTLELKAHDWARSRKLEETDGAFRDQLPAIRKVLCAGSSPARKETLERIGENGILWIMPDHALAWFAHCATDSEAAVRAQAARMIGERWILKATRQDPGAVELMLKLSKDDARAVRYNATYYGLSVISPKNEVVIRRLIEVAAQERKGDLIERIRWGLRAYGPQVREMLDSGIGSKDEKQSATGQNLRGPLAE